MPGLFSLSINPERYQGDFLEDLFLETFYHQHRGEEFGGLATLNQEKIKIRTHRGFFRATFANDLRGLEGTEGIGYCGPKREPYFCNSRLGPAAFCFSGNAINLTQLLEEFKGSGHIFERGDDIEIIVRLVASGHNLIEGMKKMVSRIYGAYSLLILTQKGIYAFRSPEGHWPLVIGEKEGAVVIASETGGFGNLGFKVVKDVRPGEIVLLRDGCWQTRAEAEIPTERKRVCSFLWVYTGFPSSQFEGISASLVRKKLGASLARRDIDNGFIPDIVCPVPDSGRFHAIGYHQEFCRQMMAGKVSRVPFYDELLLKYPYAGRSFTPQKQEARDTEARIKLLESGEDFQGKVVVVCDDSIVRGTQIRTNLVPKLRMAGVGEIHLRISNPELRSFCPWGKTTQEGEMFVSRFPSIEERVGFLKVESLEYNTIDDLVRAIGLPEKSLCIDCSLCQR